MASVISASELNHLKETSVIRGKAEEAERIKRMKMEEAERMAKSQVGFGFLDQLRSLTFGFGSTSIILNDR